MLVIEKLALAEQDLINLWLYTYHTWGESQADLYLDGLEKAFALLAEQPLLCKQRTEFSPPVRIHHHRKHLIVYLAESTRIVIVRVLHESMDIESQLDPAI